MIVKKNIAIRIAGKVSRYIDASMNRATPSMCHLPVCRTSYGGCCAGGVVPGLHGHRARHPSLLHGHHDPPAGPPLPRPASRASVAGLASPLPPPRLADQPGGGARSVASGDLDAVADDRDPRRRGRGSRAVVRDERVARFCRRRIRRRAAALDDLYDTDGSR